MVYLYTHATNYTQKKTAQQNNFLQLISLYPLQAKQQNPEPELGTLPLDRQCITVHALTILISLRVVRITVLPLPKLKAHYQHYQNLLVHYCSKSNKYIKSLKLIKEFSNSSIKNSL